MSGSELRASKVRRAVLALRNDLVDETGPKISTLRGYPFAILVYAPEEEFQMRQEVHALTKELEHAGWFLHTLNMQALMMRKLREFFTAEELDDLVELETELSSDGDADAALDYIRDAVFDALHGPNGLAEVVAEEIAKLAEDEERRERTVVFIGQLGALYPFTRTSALLKFLDGRTQGIPVVFLYPGTERDGGLSFLDEAEIDRDYRPRIYNHDSLAY